MVDKVIELLERFFLDLVATLAPGILFFFGLFVVLGHTPVDALALPTASDSLWWLWIPLTYASGHFLTGLGNWLLVPVWLKLAKGRLQPALIPAEYENFVSITSRPSVAVIKKEIPALREVDLTTKTGRSALRNIAFTAVGSENISTIIRFTALSLLCLNVAVGTVILTFVYAYPRVREQLSLAYTITQAGESLQLDIPSVFQLLGIVLVISLVILTMMRRHLEFWSRSQYLQYDMLAGILAAQGAGLLPKKGTADEKPMARQPGTGPAHRPLVYLSGGHHSGWQRQVKAAVPQFDYLDPSMHHIGQADAYTAWDLAAVRACDFVFAYLESSNPSGYGLSVEIGYARALEKFVVLVDEKSRSDTRLEKRLRILQSTASVVFSRFSDGVHYLRSLAELPRV